MKSVLLYCSILTITCMWPIFNIRKYTFATLVFIFFPIIIPFMGKDALTTGTVCIFLLYVKYFLNLKNTKKEKLNPLIYIVILLGAASTIIPYLTGGLNQTQVGEAIRHYMEFFGAMLFFLVLINYRPNHPQFNMASSDHVEKLLNLIILLISIHIIISILVKFFPSFGMAFSPFLSRTQATLEISGKGGIDRVNTFVFGYEALGEILAVMAPILVYKVFSSRDKIWIFCFLLFCSGVILTATRSGIILFMFGTLSSTIIFSKQNVGKAFAFIYALCSLLILLIFFYPSAFADILSRFSNTATVYDTGGSVLALINRENVFMYAWELTISKLSLFGNGSVLSHYHFHNLLLTTVHQKGIIGAFFFFTLLLYPFRHLINAYKILPSANHSLVVSCLVSMIIFFINEIKFEFTRTASYQQICWGLFAVYYLIAKNVLQGQFEKKAKNIL